MRLTDFSTEKHGFETKLQSPGARPHKCPEKEDYCSRESLGPDLLVGGY